MPPAKPSSVSAPSEKRFSLLNVTYNRTYYRQFFSQNHTQSYRLLGICIGLCGTAAAVGTVWYTKIQAEQAMIQAEQAKIQTEQAKQQTYHTAREADVAAVDAGLISKEEYYKRHPEDFSEKKK